MLSTFHDDTFIEKRWRTRLVSDGVEVIEKPAVVEDYNLHMGGVDKGKNCSVHRIVHIIIQPTKFMTSADQMILYYGFAHCSIKWWKRVFFHILDTAIVNAHPVQCVFGYKANSAGVLKGSCRGIAGGV